MTPQNLKHFRSLYCLTIAQASRAVGVSHKAWWRAERGLDPIPKPLVSRIETAERHIQRALASLTARCQYCTKDVRQSKHTWQQSGKPMHLHNCPYCGRASTMARKKLLAQAVPVKPIVLDDKQIYRQSLDKIKNFRKVNKKK